MSSPAILHGILNQLNVGIPLDHANRMDARMTQLEGMMKQLVGEMLGNMQSTPPTGATITMAPAAPAAPTPAPQARQ